jgi:hypothetical protein
MPSSSVSEASLDIDPYAELDNRADAEELSEERRKATRAGVPARRRWQGRIRPAR